MSPILRAPGWLPAHRARLEALLVRLAATEGRRIATFDWDQTMMRGDIGDLALARCLDVAPDHPLPPAVPHLVPAARRALDDAPPALRARLAAHVALRGALPDGTPAFAPAERPGYRATYGFLAQLVCHGRTEDEVRALGRAVFARAEAAPIGAPGDAAGVPIEGFARLHAPMVELAAALEAVGVEVHVVSASPQALVEAVAALAGIPASRVVGVRFERGADGRMTGTFARCGHEPPTHPVMSWGHGKRRWIERAILGLGPTDEDAPSRAPVGLSVLAAGDSEGDLAMLEDAGVRVVLDRGAPALAARVASDPDRWLAQPLFVAPIDG